MNEKFTTNMNEKFTPNAIAAEKTEDPKILKHLTDTLKLHLCIYEEITLATSLKIEQLSGLSASLLDSDERPFVDINSKFFIEDLELAINKLIRITDIARSNLAYLDKLI